MRFRVGMFGVLALGLVAAASSVEGCGGNDGPAGPAGATGATGAMGGPGATGATGPAGTGTTPSLSAVFPRTGLLARELDVFVTAEAEMVSASSTLDFGMGVTVSNVTPISPTSLAAHLKIDAKAPTGAHDVKLTAGTSSVTGTGAFIVAAPLQVSDIQGNQKQGGIFTANLYDIDHQALDPASLAFSPQLMLFPWTGQVGPTATNGTFAFLVDPLAPTGKSGFVASQLNGSITFATNPDAINVAANPAVAFTGSKSGALANAGDTALYKLTTAGAAILHSRFTMPTTSALSPYLVMFGKGGMNADLINQAGLDPFAGAVPDTVYGVPAMGDTYFVVADTNLSGGADHTYDLSVTSTDVPAGNVVASTATGGGGEHSKISTAQPLTNGLPAIVTGQIKSNKTTPDLQLFSFTVGGGGGDAGADAGAPNELYEISITGPADLAVWVCPKPASGDTPDLQACNNTIPRVTNFMPSSPNGFGTMTTPITTPGTYYLLVVGLYGGNYPAGPFVATIRKTN